VLQGKVFQQDQALDLMWTLKILTKAVVEVAQAAAEQVPRMVDKTIVEVLEATNSVVAPDVLLIFLDSIYTLLVVAVVVDT
jgi:hypothetical protein